jgi:hypothetical protein
MAKPKNFVAVALDPAEYDALKEAAAADFRTVSGVLRLMAREYVRRYQNGAETIPKKYQTGTKSVPKRS